MSGTLAALSVGRPKRRLLSRLLCLIAVSLAAVTGAPPATATTPIVNSGFDGQYYGGVFRGWKDNSGWADVKLRYSADSVEAHRGQAQRIECIHLKSGAVQFVHPGIRLSKFRKYEIRVWLKGRLDAPVELLFRRNGAPYTSYASRSFRISDGWQEYAFVAAPTDDDDNALLMVRFTSTGTLWIDELTVTDVTNRPSRTSRATGNLIANGGFEVGLDRWGIQIRESGGYQYQMPIELLNPKADIDTTRSHSGRRSLRIRIPPHGLAILTSPYVQLTPTREHMLSLWVMADRPREVRLALSSGSFGQSSSYHETFSVGPAWQKLTLSATPAPAPDDAYHVVLDSSGEGSLWLDDIQLAEGSDDSFQSRRPVEVGFVREGVSALHALGDPVRFGLRVSANSHAGNISLSVRSVDYYGREQKLWSGQLARMVPGEVRNISIDHSADLPGYYRLVAEVTRNGTPLDSSEMAIGIVRPRTLVPALASPFGNHVVFNRDELAHASKLGVSWLRMNPPLGTKWFLAEREKGRFTFEDAPVQLARTFGFHILGSLDATPRWASQAPADLTNQLANGFRSYPPVDIEDWERYVFAMVSHYRGTIDHWEVWNEPDSDGFLKVPGLLGDYRKPEVYVELLKSAYRAAKRANPNAVIVAGCATGQPPSKWTERIFSLGAYDYLDVLSFHFYTDGRPGDVLDTPTGDHVDELRNLMRTYGRGNEKPIWESESGIQYSETQYRNILQPTPGYAANARESVAYLVRNYVHLVSRGVTKWFYYDMFTSRRIDRPEYNGFFEWDGSPRPLALAHAHLTWMLADSPFRRILDLPNDAVAVEFADTRRTVLVVWKKTWSESAQSDTTVTHTSASPLVTVSNAMGNIIRKVTNVSSIRLTVSREPVYVVFSAPQPVGVQ